MNDDRHPPGTCVLCDEDRRAHPVAKVRDGCGRAIARLALTVVILVLGFAMLAVAWSWQEGWR